MRLQTRILDLRVMMAMASLWVSSSVLAQTPSTNTTVSTTNSTSATPAAQSPSDVLIAATKARQQAKEDLENRKIQAQHYAREAEVATKKLEEAQAALTKLGGVDQAGSSEASGDTVAVDDNPDSIKLAIAEARAYAEKTAADAKALEVAASDAQANIDQVTKDYASAKELAELTKTVAEGYPDDKAKQAEAKAAADKLKLFGPFEVALQTMKSPILKKEAADRTAAAAKAELDKLLAEAGSAAAAAEIPAAKPDVTSAAKVEETPLAKAQKALAEAKQAEKRAREVADAADTAVETANDAYEKAGSDYNAALAAVRANM
jgi:trimeric autotransporter adhesin